MLSWPARWWGCCWSAVTLLKVGHNADTPVWTSTSQLNDKRWTVFVVHGTITGWSVQSRSLGYCFQWHSIYQSNPDDFLSTTNNKQESCAIAKMTAQCALHMGALKNFGTPWLRQRPLFPIFSEAFVPVDPMNVPTKFEVRSFTRCWDNRGYPKNWAVPGYDHAPFSEKF